MMRDDTQKKEFFQVSARIAFCLAALVIPSACFQSPQTSNAALARTRHYRCSHAATKSDHHGFSQDLIQCLDLIPLVHGVAAHAATRRGRQAILSLVGNDESKFLCTSSDGKTSSRARRVSDPVLYRQSEQVSLRNAQLAPLATSARQAREQYELVEQAVLALDGYNGISYPPIYGANSSPFDTKTTADTDHDDWMYLPGDQLSLEHVLQAEQVVHMLLQVKEWSCQIETETWIPSLCHIVKAIDDEVLIPIQKELDGAVEIVRVKSLTDPNGRSTYLFRLAETKYPHLKELRSREAQLAELINTEMKIVLRKQKGSPECVDYEGRTVLLVPKASVSAEFGIVRGLTENGGRCYVEPRPLVRLGDELKLLRDELKKAEAILQHQLIQTILKGASLIDAGIYVVARLDVVFSKAAFGILLKGTIPKVGEKGRISVDRFVHPVLALQDKDTVVPVDLRMYNDESNRVLIISGPNGGGKSLAMKSFGLVCLQVKMALPITSAATKSSPSPVVDYFENILIEMGDQQNIVEGESTFMARLNCLSSVIQRVLPPISLGKAIEPQIPTSSLVLLDELGGGTDPAAGGAIAQAILEKLLEAGNCRIVATTHSPRLKALSYSNEDYECATVLLKRRDQSDLKLPTYQLQYGLIGDSYALGAASRANPSLPNDVLARAASLLATSNTASNEDASSGELLRAMTDSLEKQIQAAEESRKQAEATQKDARDCRDALIALSSAYEKHLGKLEDRLERIYKELQLDESKSSLEVVGETLATLRTAKMKVKSEDELLRERGLKRVQDYYQLVDGEKVVIIAGGDWEGMSGTIVINANEPCNPGEVRVALSLGEWSDPYFQNDEPQDLMVHSLSLTFGRHQIATWDYASVWDEERSTMPTTSVRESRQRLSSLLTSLPSSSSKLSTIDSSQGLKLAESGSFTSSRQRKATAAKKRKKKS